MLMSTKVLTSPSRAIKNFLHKALFSARTYHKQIVVRYSFTSIKVPQKAALFDMRNYYRLVDSVKISSVFKSISVR